MRLRSRLTLVGTVMTGAFMATGIPAYADCIPRTLQGVGPCGQFGGFYEVAERCLHGLSAFCPLI